MHITQITQLQSNLVAIYNLYGNKRLNYINYPIILYPMGMRTLKVKVSICIFIGICTLTTNHSLKFVPRVHCVSDAYTCLAHLHNFGCDSIDDR